MKKIIFTLLILLFSSTISPRAETISGVVELFTSQGCHSCPPADKILGEYASEYAGKKNILALSWHVDYWNYLGWQDIFSNERFTNRQKLYAKSFGARNIYTPQAVINGKVHVVGSSKAKIESAMKQNSTITVPIAIIKNDDKIIISIEGENLPQSQLTVIYFQNKQSVKIARGENAGKQITYHNIVKDFFHKQIVSKEINIELPLSELKGESMAILLQKNEGGVIGKIIGARVLYNLQI